MQTMYKFGLVWAIKLCIRMASKLNLTVGLTKAVDKQVFGMTRVPSFWTASTIFYL